MVEILGKVERASLFCFIVLISSEQTFEQVPPGLPTIVGPHELISGNQYTLTCTVDEGDPTPTVKWLIDNKVIDDSFTTVGSVTTNEYTFTASKDEHLEVFECQSENGVLQNPLSRIIFVEVQFPPRAPILTGPTDILDGTLHTWRCQSDGAYPQQTMQMRIRNVIFSNSEFASVVQFDRVDKSYTAIGSLNWAPTSANHGSSLVCEVFHVSTMGPNVSISAMLPLAVKCANPPVVNISEDKYQQTFGLSVTLNCQVSSSNSSVHSVEWIFTSKSNQVTDPIVITSPNYYGSSTTTPSLTISDVQFSDEGIYRCKVTNLLCTTVSKEISLYVFGTPPGAPVITEPLVIILGNQYTLTCTVNGGVPTPTVKWLLDNIVIDDSFIKVGSVTTNNFTFTASRHEHLQVFECQSNNGVLQTPLSRTTLVKVHITPSPPIITGPTDVLDGTSHTWTCRSSGAYPQQTMQMRVGSAIFW